MKKIKWLATLFVLTIFLAACSSEGGTAMTPQEIIENIIKEDKQPFAYYAESTVTLSDGMKYTMKEWRDGTGKIRTEVSDQLGNSSFSVNDGKIVWTYDSASNQVFMIDLQDFDEESLNKLQTEQAKQLVKAIENTHTIEIVGNEKLLDRDVIHVKAVPNKNEENLFGETELWIDQETWLILKMISKIDDTVSTTEYTKLEIDPKLDEDLFVFEIPEGAEVVDINELSDELVVKTVEEVKQYIDKPFYYVEDEGDITLHDINVFTMENVPAQLTLNYIKEGLPYFSIVVTEVGEENKAFDGEGMNVRGQEGVLHEMGEFRSISWVEDGIGYTVLIDSVEATTDEVLELIENMKLSE